MGLFGKKVKSATVGLYGKHPAADDFLRRNAGTPMVRSLDEWLSNALAAAQRLVPDWETTYARCPSLSFVYGAADAKGGTALVGTLSPSTDRIGRQYPLILFAEVDAEMLAQSYPVLPCSRFLEELERMQAGRSRYTRESLVQALERLAPPDAAALKDAALRLERFTEDTTCADAFRGMFDDEGQEETAVGALQDVCRAAGPGRPPGFGLRFPLGESRSGTASLWLELTRSMLRERLLPSALWSDRALLLYFAKLPAKALTALWRPGWQDDSVFDMSTARSERGVRRPLQLDRPLRTLWQSLP